MDLLFPNQCPITAIHLQFPPQTQLGPTPRLLQNSLYPVMNGAFGNVRRTTTNSGPTLNLRGANKMCNCVDPGGEDFMPFECPAHVRRRVPNGSAEFSKMNVQGLWVFVVHGRIRCPPAKHARDETTESKLTKRCDIRTLWCSKIFLLA